MGLLRIEGGRSETEIHRSLRNNSEKCWGPKMGLLRIEGGRSETEIHRSLRNNSEKCWGYQRGFWRRDLDQTDFCVVLNPSRVKREIVNNNSSQIKYFALVLQDDIEVKLLILWKLGGRMKRTC
jgi:hypothetical protein